MALAAIHEGGGSQPPGQGLSQQCSPFSVGKETGNGRVHARVKVHSAQTCAAMPAEVFHANVFLRVNETGSPAQCTKSSFKVLKFPFGLLQVTCVVTGLPHKTEYLRNRN